MLMTFSRERYMERILAGVKVHTIREDKGHRWRVGMTAHMWMHNPRNKSMNPFQFATAEVSDIAQIWITKSGSEGKTSWGVFVNGQKLHSAQIDKLAKADGFDSGWEFLDWFGEFTGRLIYWKKLKPFPETA